LKKLWCFVTQEATVDTVDKKELNATVIIRPAVWLLQVQKACAISCN
jgi:hypothetical protein